jgi:23S rRNA pseudouridine1911/1915/1917 synthase
LFAQHQIQKTYQCLAARLGNTSTLENNQRFQIDNYLGKISKGNEKSKFGSVTSGGDRAITDFRVTEVFHTGYWFEAKPKTGRTHQIRVHASESGYPLMGDPLYFPKGVFSMVQVPRLMLHASHLEFLHPMTQKSMLIEAPIPQDMINVLASLR